MSLEVEVSRGLSPKELRAPDANLPLALPKAHPAYVEPAISTTSASTADTGLQTEFR